MLFLILLFLSFVLALIAGPAAALEVNGKIVTIHNASDFIGLSDNVNKKNITYEGSTVLLAADIDFTGYSDKFIPIGLNTHSRDHFFGAFDGQGYTISNLNMNSSLQNVGLFGHINGTSFKNLVVDSSCSFSSTYNLNLAGKENGGFVAGVIACANPTMTTALISGCVNMASVTSLTTVSGDPSSLATKVFGIGGIIGGFNTDNHNLEVRDCVNYGTITHAGRGAYASISGIVSMSGNVFGSQKQGCTITNCANYGRLVHSGTTDNMLIVGGIIGGSTKGKIENCINYATYRINYETTAIGKIIGAADVNTKISNCFWTDESDTINETCGFFYQSSPTMTNSHLMKSNATTMNILNEWVSTRSGGGEYNHFKWMMLHLNGGRMGTVNEDDLLIVPQKPFPEPAKEGHAFSCWCTDPECTFGEYNGTLEDVTDLYAEWEIGVYTVTFDYGNGTLIYSSFTFNTTIVYPDMSGVKGFHGWNSSIERMPGHNLVIGPDTTPPPSKSHAGAIAGGVIGGVALIAIIAIIVLFFVMRRTRNRGEDQYELARDPRFSRGRDKGRRTRRTARTARRTEDRRDRRLERRGIGRRTGGDRTLREMDPGEDASGDADGYSAPSMSTAFTDTLYPELYNIPTMMEGLKEAGIGKRRAKHIVDTCKSCGSDAVRNGSAPEGFTEADAAAVAMYTFDFDPEENDYSPYELIDDALAVNGDIESVRGILFILMRALRKLPRCEDRLLYRSLRGAVDANTYKKGSVVMWPAIVSTSPDMGAAKKLIEEANEAEGEENAGNVRGTLFVIEDAWGYNIQPYSLFPDDGEEILLEPERRFRVDSVIVSDVTIVNLKMLDTPLVLPQVFGDNATK